ncbi:MAG: type II toxin-antitoxin system prevent-host-death family antitoxin [Burkholderiaceae bacterium]
MSASKTISVGQLRQNPTQMIREVRAGARYVLTDRGVPVADIAPHRERRGVPSEQAAEELRRISEQFGPDPDWLKLIEEGRDADLLEDPYQRAAEPDSPRDGK